MKVVEPSALLREAAEVLEPVRGEVVVIGAAAVEVALAGASRAITPTRDVDLVVHTRDVESVVTQLEGRRAPPQHARLRAGVHLDQGRSQGPADPRIPSVPVRREQAIAGQFHGRSGASQRASREDLPFPYMLFAHVPEEVRRGYQAAKSEVRERVRNAAQLLREEGGDPLRLAAEEMVSGGQAANQRDAEAEILLTAEAFAEALE